MQLRAFHLACGTLGLVLFLLSGQYMDRFHAHLVGMADGPRLLFRSSHIYLLWSSLLNVLLGCYLAPVLGRIWRYTQAAASIAVMLGPFLLVASFLVESSATDMARPIARAAIYFAFGGTIAHAVIVFVMRLRTERT